MITDNLVMSIALMTFGMGTVVMMVRWLRCVYLQVPFPRFPKLLLLLGFVATVICVLFFAGIERLTLQYIYSFCGIIYLISVVWIQRKETL